MVLRSRASVLDQEVEEKPFLESTCRFHFFYALQASTRLQEKDVLDKHLLRAHLTRIKPSAMEE